MNNYFDQHFEMRYHEMNKFGMVSPASLLTLLEETAADHCASIGHGLFDLEKNNIGWVLLSGYMEMDRYPCYKEKIIIRTWIKDYSLVRGCRETIIIDEEQKTIGRARSLWVFFDIEKKKPVRIYDDIKQKWSSFNELSVDHDISKKIIEIDSGKYERKYTVNTFDTDMNNHVNNIRYLQWALDSLPEEIEKECFLHSIDGRFLGEAQYGDIILSLTDDGDTQNSFHHMVKKKDNETVCARATTTWKNLKQHQSGRQSFLSE